MPLTILPTAGQSLNVTRDPVRNNFQLIQTSFTQDHVDFGIANTGKHNSVTFPVVAADTGVPPEIALYTKLFGGQPTLYLHKTIDSGATDYIIPASGCSVDVAGAPVDANGWTYLPSGIFIAWGNGVFGGLGNINVVLPTGAPHSLVTAIVCPRNTGAAATVSYVSVGAPATTTFICNVTAVGGFNYLAIGY